MRFYLVFIFLSCLSCGKKSSERVEPASEQVGASSDQTQDHEDILEEPSSEDAPEEEFPPLETPVLPSPPPPSSLFDVPFSVDELCSWNMSSDAGSDETAHIPIPVESLLQEKFLNFEKAINLISHLKHFQLRWV
jgi:hypothetical protein